MLHRGVDFVKRCSKIILGDRTLDLSRDTALVGTRHCRVPTRYFDGEMLQLKVKMIYENPKLPNR